MEQNFLSGILIAGIFVVCGLSAGVFMLGLEPVAAYADSVGDNITFQENLSNDTYNSGGTHYIGDMYTDGKADTAISNGGGSVTVPEGMNTFTVNCHNSHDVDLDGQGGVYELRVWDTENTSHTDRWETDRTGSHTLSVRFNSMGTGDACYQLYCQTNTWHDKIQAEGTYTGKIVFN